MSTRVKICGICRIEDAVAAARLGAHAIGMVLHEPSPRNVSLELAGQIMAALPPFVTPVGLFVDQPADVVAEVVHRLGLRHLQLHGRETAEIVARVIALTGASVIKAVRVDRETFKGELEYWHEATTRLGLNWLKGLVLETAGTQEPGGTGAENDWDAVEAVQQEGIFGALPPIIAAGGLRPETVARVVHQIHPWAVDVSSGVELVRGQKSEEKMLAFIDAVRQADCSDSTKASATTRNPEP